MPIVERLSAGSDCPECDFFFRVEMIETREEAVALAKMIAEMHGEMAHGNKDTIPMNVEETTSTIMGEMPERPGLIH